MAVEEIRTYPVEHLRDFSARVFGHFGVPADDAARAADVLADADLRGIDSHGVARLHTYFDMFTLGRINPRPNVRVVRELPGTATVDGDNGLGLVVGPRANAVAMDKAVAVGSGWVAVRNTNHFGIAGYYPLQALKRDLIGWAMTNSTKLVAPLWGAERMLGTNPLAVAFPGRDEPPVVIDFATSATRQKPLWPPCSRSPPKGTSAPPSIICRGRVAGRPSRSSAQPSGISLPARSAISILP